MFDPDVLARMGDPSTEGQPDLERYLQLPGELPARVRALADQITADPGNPYERALAVQAWLQANTVYDLTVAREPDGVDAVDHFLFETQRGFCEHIASAMVVLLRAAGVPARIATGYGPGARNPLTGYHEVRWSDAHAWVEVLMPQQGWMTFDPTFGVPPAEPSWGSRFVAPEVIAAIGRAVAGVVPPGLREAVGDAVRAIGAGLRDAAGAIVAFALAAALGVGLILALRRRRRGRDPGPPDDVGRAFEELVAALGAAGHPRAPSATPREYLAEVRADDGIDEETRQHAALVVATLERERFAPPSARPGEADVMRALAAAARVRDLVARR